MEPAENGGSLSKPPRLSVTRTSPPTRVADPRIYSVSWGDFLEPYENGAYAGGVKEAPEQPWEGPDWGPEDTESAERRNLDFERWLKGRTTPDGEENAEQYLAKRYAKMEILKRQRDGKPGRRDVALDRQKWNDHYDTTIDKAESMLTLYPHAADESSCEILGLLGHHIAPNDPVWYRINTVSVVDDKAARHTVSGFLVGVHETKLVLIAELKFSKDDHNREPEVAASQALHNSELFFLGLSKWATNGPVESKREKMEPPASRKSYDQVIERQLREIREPSLAKDDLTKGKVKLPTVEKRRESGTETGARKRRKLGPSMGGETGVTDGAESSNETKGVTKTKDIERVMNTQVRSDNVGSDDVEGGHILEGKTSEVDTGDDSEIPDDKGWQTRSFKGLHAVWQYHIINPMTRNVIISAHRDMGKSLLCWGRFQRSSSVHEDGLEWKYFKQLLATDNGRPVFMMLNDHAKDFGNLEVQEIWTFPPGSARGLDCFHMILRVGPAEGNDEEKSVDGEVL
ncbi:hypothetical protein FKW77_001079 [Venturia effusa]|uniref:Uncharacterized protein n=1 Tax=Venturia effusa TaxID=50376 RepID=A0A517LNF3_9PEZI|nr:hypothetical protein FKW77_001079 [Venturia effusa]